MALHRSLEPDWHSLTSVDYNFWQRLAAKSNGWLTPGNVISFFGVALVLVGLLLLAENHFISALIFMATGRSADVLDGLIADKTNTKSPLGEAIDATSDKTTIFIALIAIIALGDVPLGVAIVIAFKTVLNICLFMIANSRNKRLHPSALGKLTTLLEWLSIGLFIFHEYLKLDQHQAHVSWLIATFVFIAFIPAAVISSISYVMDLTQ